MDPRSLSWVLEAVGEGSLDGDARVEVTGVRIDSREVREGDLFVAIAGDRTDGHRYVAEAFRRGARAAVVARDVPEADGAPLLRVPDTRRALGLIARAYRRECGATIVAITGSNGKTTTKEFTAHLLGAVGKVVKAAKSYNNDIGVPLTLLSMDAATKFCVVEMGTNHPGEIAALCRIAEPDIGVVTNVSRAHLEGFGDILAIAEEKGALIEALPAHGFGFVNDDDFHCREMERRARCPVARFGRTAGADVYGLAVRRLAGGIAFRLFVKAEVFLPVPGLHNVMNALAAIGVALRCGVPASAIVGRLRTVVLPEMRLATERIEGVTLINDAYNANPASVAAAIEELAETPAEGRRILVLGEMCELGEAGAACHEEAGRRAGLAGIGTVFAVGRYAAEVERGLCSVEHWNGAFFSAPSTEAALTGLPFDVEPGDTVLVKGSRRMALERLCERIRDEALRMPGRVVQVAVV